MIDPSSVPIDTLTVRDALTWGGALLGAMWAITVTLAGLLAHDIRAKVDDMAADLKSLANSHATLEAKHQAHEKQSDHLRERVDDLVDWRASRHGAN